MRIAERRVRAGLSFFALFMIAAPVLSARADDSNIPQIVVTPNYWPTSVGRTGSTISVISHRQIEESSAGSLKALLQTVPGVTVTETGGTGGQAYVSLRGAATGSTLVLIDGVRVNDASSANNAFDFSTLSTDGIERIEILRGPQSALYGSDAMGGVINIITRRGSGAFHSSASIEGGSYGTWRTMLSASGTSGPYSVFASGSIFDTHGFSRVGSRDSGEPDGSSKFSGTIHGAYDPGGGFRFEYGLDGYHSAADLDAGAGHDATGYTTARDLISGYGRLLFPSADGRIDNSLTFFGTHTTRLYSEPTDNYAYRAGSLGAEYQSHIKLSGGQSLLLGARVEQQTAYQKPSYATMPSFDAKNWLYAGYFLYSLPVGDRLNLSYAGRYDGADKGEGFLTGRATAVYDIPEIEARVHASVGSGAKRPTPFQLSYNPVLQPEKSFGADLGFDRTLFDGRLKVSATAFYNHFSNLIDFTGGYFSGTYQNIARAETEGVELSGTATIVPGVLTSTASYTYTKARDLDTGLPTPRQPENSGSLALTYMHGAKFDTTATATFVGKRFNDSAASVVLDPYVRVDLAANYRATPSLTFFGRIVNLLNADYEDVTGYNTAGRSAYVGLRWSH